MGDSSDQERVAVAIGRDLTINRVMDLKEEIMTALEEAETVVLELDEVTDVDAVGIQLLWAAHRSAVEAGRELILENANGTILDAAKALAVPPLPETSVYP